MKANYLCGIITLLLAISCTSPNQNRFRLEARIAEARSAELASLTYPVYREGTWYKQTDSARVVDGRIHIEGEISGITPAYLTFENMDEVGLYLVPGTMHLQMSRLHPYDFTCPEVPLMEEVEDYRKQLGAVPRRAYEKSRRAMEINEQWAQASAEERDTLWRQFLQAVQGFKLELAVEDSLRMAFVARHPDYTIAPHLLYLSIRTGRNDSDHLRALYDRISETAENRILRELAGIQLSYAPGETGYEVGDRACNFERRGGRFDPVVGLQEICRAARLLGIMVRAVSEGGSRNPGAGPQICRQGLAGYRNFGGRRFGSLAASSGKARPRLLPAGSELRIGQ